MVEILVVLAIVGILTALLLPAVSKLRRSGTEVACLNNMRQLAAATNLYMADNGQKYPEANNWAYLLLPYLVPDNPGTLVSGTAYFSSVSPRSCVFYCPGAAPGSLTGNTPKYRYGSGTIAYGINATTVANNNSDPNATPRTPMQLPSSHDGVKLARLMLYGEGNLLNLFWGSDERCSVDRHGVGMNVAFCDFHVEYVPYPVTNPNFQNLYFGYEAYK